MRMALRGLTVAVIGWLIVAGVANGRAAPNTKQFVSALKELADQQGFPGFSAAMVQNGKVVWSGGFGYADIGGKVAADADTPYRVASLSKPMAAVILMQLVEAGKLELDDPMHEFRIRAWFEPGGGSWAHYPSRYDDKRITVRHVLMHTSQSDPPGESYRYSGNIFADLTWVIEDVTRQSYPDVVVHRILEPLGMTHSSPGELVPARQDVVRSLASPYQLENGIAVPGTYPGFGLDPDVDVTPWGLDPAYRIPRETQAARREYLGNAFTPLYSSQTAAGMICSVGDLARFDIAFDSNRLVSERTREQMFTPTTTSKGEVLPYGLGWFVEEWEGTKVVWHYGWFPPTVSALYVKVPGQQLTFIILTNCDGLSVGVSWTAEGVRASPFVRLFLDTYASKR